MEDFLDGLVAILDSGRITGKEAKLGLTHAFVDAIQYRSETVLDFLLQRGIHPTRKFSLAVGLSLAAIAKDNVWGGRKSSHRP